MYTSGCSFQSSRINPANPSLKYSIGGIIFCILLFFFWIYQTGNITIPEGVYRVSKGDTTTNLDRITMLDISHVRYNLWIRLFAPSLKNLQVGEYRTEEAETLNNFFLKTLNTPSHTDQTITILPGWNIYDIDDYLTKKELISPGELIKVSVDNWSIIQSRYEFLSGRDSVEGFLYPDTYRIRQDASALQILYTLLDEFDKKISPSYKTLGKSAYETLILASIVEREERSNMEQSTVAGILAKRVKEGIPMGADATVCTGYAKTQKQCTPLFIDQVIYQKHPFNTRNKQGYPPTPICSVPLQTWKNTLSKKDSPYYYYLHDSDGVIHYAKTIEEHGMNKRKYLQ